MAVDKDIVQFRAGDPAEVVGRMRTTAERNDGKAWVNIQPWVDPENQPKVSLLRHIFSSRGQAVPTATWVPGHTSGKQPTHTELGIQHGAGHNALTQLAEAGVKPPEHWISIQDHTRRGLIFAVPRDEEPTAALEYILAASTVLSQIPTDDRWLAGFVTQV